jgi:hypothetical protein
MQRTIHSGTNVISQGQEISLEFETNQDLWNILQPLSEILHTNNHGKDLLQLSFVRELTNAQVPKWSKVLFSNFFIFGKFSK